MKDKIITLWKNPRGHAFLVLGGYALFFGMFFLYISIRSNSVENPLNLSALEKLKQMNDYDYRLQINGEIITGHILDDQNIFLYQNQEYLYKKEETFEYQEIMPYTNAKFIYEMIHQEELESKTEYKNGSIAKLYKGKNREITTYEKNDEIYEIDIRLPEASFQIIYH